MDEQIKMVAARIRDLREIFGFDVDMIADKLNISTELYEQYESFGKDIPISVIYSICNIYNVDMTELLSGQSPKLNTISIVRKGEGLSIDRYEGYKYENIGFKFMHRKMEPMIVTLESDGARPKMVTHSGQEINYCLYGEVVLSYDGNEVTLHPGDCAYFDPSKPHGQYAENGRAAFLTIIQE